jgi:tetratricopeptide (TPR) repeat protein
MTEEFNEADAVAELERLRAKMSKMEDEDIRLALQARIDTLETQLFAKKKKPAGKEEDSLEPPPKPTHEQERQADQLIRQAKVEKMRNNGQQALKLMKEAAAIAPGSVAVLEALADDLIERRQYKDAMDTFKRALLADPKNIGIEKKLAQTSLRVSPMGISIDAQLRAGLSDSVFLTGEDAVASVTAARFINALVPGVGHMVLGRTWTGLTIFVLYVLSVLWAALMRNDVMGIIKMVAGRPEHPNLLVMLPLFFAIVLWIGAQASLGSGAKSHARTKVERPTPPVDLPFD